MRTIAGEGFTGLDVADIGRLRADGSAPVAPRKSYAAWS